MYKILIIEDERSLRLGLSHALKSGGYAVKSADNGAEGLKLAGTESFDAVVTDLRLPDTDGMEILKALRTISPDTGVIVMTAFAEIKTAVEAMREGAYDYISKPFDPDELLMVIDRFIKHRELESENIRLKETVRECRQFEDIVGAGPAMQQIFDMVGVVAKTDSAVMIYGESGTGKELVANAIHNLSPRRDKAFIKINCAAIPDTLLESELFGHEKGAFTGAVQRRKGKFEAADRGTIFLDEIGDMPLALQSKLLRVVENQAFERLGGNEPLTVNVRTIFATGKDLKAEVEAGRFRKDLFYRLNVLPITIPPLRERREDIPLLINHFLDVFGKKLGKTGFVITPAAMDILLAHDYPGNVRELKHALEMVITFCKGNIIEPSCLPMEIRGVRVCPGAQITVPDGFPVTEKVKAFERDLIARALEETGGKKKETAKKLGISRGTLWRKLKEHGFPVSESEMKE
jgi:DNA-binding NtrC family response regulator